MKISILCPTRGRPENMKRIVQSLHDTSSEMPEVVSYVDSDDKTWKELPKEVKVIRAPRQLLSRCWNDCIAKATGEILMQAGDDIVFKTPMWDRMVVQAFEEVPDRLILVHGDDGNWGNEFGTHCFVHRNWVRTLGYFSAPYFSSDFSDTWLNDVANAVGRRVFLPFLTEHMHPLFGKGEWDQTHHERIERHKEDKPASRYKSMAGDRKKDVEKLRKAMQVAA